MASKGVRAIFYQGTRIFKANYKPSQITKTLIGYTVLLCAGLYNLFRCQLKIISSGILKFCCPFMERAFIAL
jgi:hypothetical protein